ncbi:MAG TPA: hypothetical protein VGD53_16850 [Actinoallomurus sp.]
MTDWVTISSLTTGAGTLVLAAATFASVRSANRAARTAERSLQAGLRPVLMASRLEDPTEKIVWMDGYWGQTKGGRAHVDVTDDAIYLAIPLRNVGSGIAVLHGWRSCADRLTATQPPPAVEHFRPQTRDLYVPGDGLGFWHGAYRDEERTDQADLAKAIENSTPLTVDLLYGDHEGGQRTISRFSVLPHSSGWVCSVVRHWNLDRHDPR